MYAYNKIKRPEQEYDTAESLLAKLYTLLNEAEEEGIKNSEQIKFALECADFETKVHKFIVDRSVSQGVLIAVFSVIVAGQIKKCEHVQSAQKQVFDRMSQIIKSGD